MAAPINRAQTLCPCCQRVMPSSSSRRLDNRYCEACYVATFEPDEPIGGEKGEIDDEAAWDERIARITGRLSEQRIASGRGGQSGRDTTIGVREYYTQRSNGLGVFREV